MSEHLVVDEPNDDALIIFTGASRRGWHRLQQAAECLQKYAFHYGVSEAQPGIVDREAEKKKPALLQGGLMHLALAQHYARIYAKQNGENPFKYEAPEDAVRFIAEHQGGKAFVDRIIAIYKAYASRYADDELRMQIVGIERLYETMIRGKYLFTGRLDLVFRDEGERLWAMDHKTTGRLTTSHKQFYAASGQLIGYQHLLRQHEQDIAGMKLNIIELSDTPKFERITLPRAPFFESEFEQTVVDIEESIERMRESGRPMDKWPKAMNEMTCFGRYGACPFLDKCKWGLDARVAGEWQIETAGWPTERNRT